MRHRCQALRALLKQHLNTYVRPTVCCFLTVFMCVSVVSVRAFRSTDLSGGARKRRQCLQFRKRDSWALLVCLGWIKVGNPFFLRCGKAGASRKNQCGKLPSLGVLLITNLKQPTRGVRSSLKDKLATFFLVEKSFTPNFCWVTSGVCYRSEFSRLSLVALLTTAVVCRDRVTSFLIVVAD